MGKDNIKNILNHGIIELIRMNCGVCSVLSFLVCLIFDTVEHNVRCYIIR